MNNKQSLINTYFKRYIHVTKASHFVKRQYLESWSKDKKRILRSINGSSFSYASLKTSCTENNIYEVKPLNKLEVIQLKYMYKDFPQEIKTINDNVINLWQALCGISSLIDDPDLKQIAENMKKQAGENLQTNFENALEETILLSLASCDESFLKNDDCLLNFSLYMFSQFLRTQKQKETVKRTYEELIKEKPELKEKMDFVKLWNPMITIMTNMAAFKMICKENLHITFLKSSKGEFLTSDQPVLNVAKDKDKDYVKFYYPLNPKLAFIFPSEKPEIIEDNGQLIESMNCLIVKESNRFVFKSDI